MGVAYNNEFGAWLAELMRERGITSSRGAKPRTGISHTTIDDILAGSRPSVETVIRIAKGFNEDISKALRLAGHDDIVEAWETGAARTLERQEDEESTGELHPDDIPPALQQVYGFQGRVYNELPPGKARDRYLNGLLAQAEANLVMLEEKFAEEEAALKERGKKPAK